MLFRASERATLFCHSMPSLPAAMLGSAPTLMGGNDKEAIACSSTATRPGSYQTLATARTPALFSGQREGEGTAVEGIFMGVLSRKGMRSGYHRDPFPPNGWEPDQKADIKKAVPANNTARVTRFTAMSTPSATAALRSGVW